MRVTMNVQIAFLLLFALLFSGCATSHKTFLLIDKGEGEYSRVYIQGNCQVYFIGRDGAVVELHKGNKTR